MLNVYKTLANVKQIEDWLNKDIRSKLKPDVSNYAKGRLRVWLDKEPMLFSPFDIKQGLPIDIRIMDRLRELIEWNFDFCLVTYSGDETPIGIDPHRDAGYSDFEARTLNISRECKFDYWMSREDFSNSKSSRSFKIEQQLKIVTEDGKPVDPTHSVILKPGELSSFNCKDPHSALPTVKRWNMNFWKAKPKRV